MSATSRVTPESVRARKGLRPRLLAVTAYDYPAARLLDEAGVDIIHVGDSLGMMIFGHPDTTKVTMADMLHHTRAVAGAKKRAMITADLPIHSYDTPASALANARALIEAGADAVKMEGGTEIAPQIQAVVAAGIPFQGHIGMLPQRVLEEGGFKKKGKTESEIAKLLEDAKVIETLGGFSVVVECVTADAARAARDSVGIPTIGIASGDSSDGEIRVFHDVLGLYPWFQPGYITPKADLARSVRDAIAALREEIG